MLLRETVNRCNGLVRSSWSEGGRWPCPRSVSPAVSLQRLIWWMLWLFKQSFLVLVLASQGLSRELDGELYRMEFGAGGDKKKQKKKAGVWRLTRATQFDILQDIVQRFKSRQAGQGLTCCHTFPPSSS